jgi:hypothetical protein
MREAIFSISFFKETGLETQIFVPSLATLILRECSPETRPSQPELRQLYTVRK